MIRIPLTLRSALRLGAHPAALRAVRSALDGIEFYDPTADGPRIDAGHLVVDAHVADAVADVLSGLDFPDLAASLRAEASERAGATARRA
jgi:hypothetical protein